MYHPHATCLPVASYGHTAALCRGLLLPAKLSASATDRTCMSSMLGTQFSLRPLHCKAVVLNCFAFMLSCVSSDTLWVIVCRARERELNAAVCQQSSGSCAACQFHPQPFAAAAAARQLRCGSAAREHRGNRTSKQRYCRHAHRHHFKQMLMLPDAMSQT